ncbi:hypothetical protein [Tautonia rosea]|uniref:hypothetical protein n=1 Tax=Tautonia rosea TaxID=2728037 RepID=UPI001473C500|nr:hypothetical protein [Tautonia rosea]
MMTLEDAGPLTLEDAGPLTLDASLQNLIDARLDTIDRMLVGRVPRADRLAIAREVEAQIFDQLAGQSADGIGRDEVLAVLGRLDPPEAYLPEDGEAGPAVSGTGEMRVSTRPIQARRSGKASGIVGIVAFTVTALWTALSYPFAHLFNSELILFTGFFGSGFVGLCAGGTAVALAAFARLRDAWAICGLVNGILTILFGLLSLAAGVCWLLLISV